MNTVKILSENPDVLSKYQDKFQYILVDEYQDTNNSQYLLINLLAQANRNLCVVGDDDQSIYKFRGANIGNILNFEDDYSCLLYTSATDKKIENGYFLTLDFGCVFEGYCSDMTRTVVVGKANDKQKEIYNTVLKAQTTAIDAIKAGMKLSLIHI